MAVIDLDEIALVLVTRGDVPLEPILDQLPAFAQVVVWDNARRPFDAKVFGRYLGILETTAPVIAFQDDDCVVRCWDQLRAFYEPGKIVANMVSEHRAGEPPMLGWGALFDRELPWRAFSRWFAAGHALDWEIARYPETVFTALTPCTRLNIGSHGSPDTKGHEDLPWAGDSSRSHRQPGHYREFDVVLQRAQAVAAGKVAHVDIEVERQQKRLDRERAALAMLRG